MKMMTAPCIVYGVHCTVRELLHMGPNKLVNRLASTTSSTSFPFCTLCLLWPVCADGMNKLRLQL